METPPAPAVGEAAHRARLHAENDFNVQSGELLLAPQDTTQVLIDQLSVVMTSATMTQVRRAFLVHHYNDDGVTGAPLRKLLHMKILKSLTDRIGAPEDN